MDNLLKQAHALWRQGRELEALNFLKEAVNMARQADQKEGLIELLNEYGGGLRVVGDYDQAIAIIGQAKDLCELKGLTKTEGYATTLMNLGNVYREKGDLYQAETLFTKAKDLFEGQNLREYAYVGLLNNYGLLMQQKGNYARANQMQLEAIDILKRDSKYLIPLATSYNNLYEIQKKLGKVEGANDYLEKARQIVESNLGLDHPLYAAVLNNMADCHYNNDQYAQALDLYQRALGIVAKTYGRKSGAYRAVEKNIDYIKEELRRRPEKKTTRKAQGLEAARALSKRVGAAIESLYPKLYQEICIGLVGKGSECYGYDDDLSKDHDYEDRCMIFLNRRTYDQYGRQLKADLAKRFKEKIEIYGIDQFYQHYTSFEKGPRSIYEFRQVGEEYLSAATNGQVFIDQGGEFTAIRNRLLNHYPQDLYYKFMVLYLNYMAQAGQYNFPRILKRGDLVAANLALNEFIKNYIYFLHLINKKYTPFYKWSFKSCQDLSIMGKYSSQALNKLVNADNSEKETIIAEICGTIVEYLNDLGLSQSRVDFLTYQAKEVEKLITNLELKTLDPWTR